MPKLDARDIIKTIAESKKKTPVKVYVKGDLASLEVPEELDAYFGDKAGVLFGDWTEEEREHYESLQDQLTELKGQ